ncbi:MAG: response regulator [Desulfobacula sp.]|nr:response regulator [Desulfobacula sp.]
MISISMVSRDKRFFDGIEGILAENQIKTDWCSTGEKALSKAIAVPMDLIIIDEDLPDMTGRQFIEKLVMKNSMIHCVVASPLTKKEFHGRYEGFGILMQFHIFPDRSEIETLLEHMNHIFNLHIKREKSR